MPVPWAMHPIPGTDMLAEFKHAIANGFAIAENARLEPSHANAHLGFRSPVAQGSKPVGDGHRPVFALVSKDFEHGYCSLEVTTPQAGTTPSRGKCHEYLEEETRAIG